MFEVSTTSFHTSPKSFQEAQYGFVDRVLWKLVPYQLQNFLELIDVLRLGLKWLVAFKHSSPDMVVQRAEVRRVGRPFIFTNEFTAVGSNSWTADLSQLCLVCMERRPVERWSQTANQICNLEHVPATGFQHKVQHSVWSCLEWNAIFPSHRNRRPQKPWRAWRTLLSQLRVDVHQRFSLYPQTKHDHSNVSQADSNGSFFVSEENRHCFC